MEDFALASRIGSTVVELEFLVTLCDRRKVQDVEPTLLMHVDVARS
jgi:hypothetical protein